MTLRILSGKWKGLTLASVKATSTRPTTSMLKQAVFNIWSEKIEGSVFLDLFAGSGAMGFEALSLGACFATWVEANPLAARTIVQNIERLACKDFSKLWTMRCELYLKRQRELFDLIFVDPPYDWKAHQEATSASSGRYVMSLARLLAGSLKPEGELMIEQDRHVEEPLEAIEGLAWLETRLYGDTLLHRFIKS